MYKTKYLGSVRNIKCKANVNRTLYTCFSDCLYARQDDVEILKGRSQDCLRSIDLGRIDSGSKVGSDLNHGAHCLASLSGFVT